MAKRKKRSTNFMKSLFGSKFNIADVIVIIILIIYIYGVFKGWGGAWWRVFDLFGGVLFFAYVIRIFVGFVQKQTEK